MKARKLSVGILGSTPVVFSKASQSHHVAQIPLPSQYNLRASCGAPVSQGHRVRLPFQNNNNWNENAFLETKLKQRSPIMLQIPFVKVPLTSSFFISRTVPLCHRRKGRCLLNTCFDCSRAMATEIRKIRAKLEILKIPKIRIIPKILKIPKS